MKPAVVVNALILASVTSVLVLAVRAPSVPVALPPAVVSDTPAPALKLFEFGQDTQSGVVFTHYPDGSVDTVLVVRGRRRALTDEMRPFVRALLQCTDQRASRPRVADSARTQPVRWAGWP